MRRATSVLSTSTELSISIEEQSDDGEEEQGDDGEEDYGYNRRDDLDDLDDLDEDAERAAGSDVDEDEVEQLGFARF